MTYWQILNFFLDAQLDTLRKILCKFRNNPSSRLGGVVRTRLFDFDDLWTYLQTDIKQIVRCTTRHPEENSVQVSAQSIQPFKSSCLDKIFWFWWLTDLLTDCACLKIKYNFWCIDEPLIIIIKILWKMWETIIRGIYTKNWTYFLFPSSWVKFWINFGRNLIQLSIIQPIRCQWFCVFVCLFANSSATANPNKLKLWGMIPLGVPMVLS